MLDVLLLSFVSSLPQQSGQSAPKPGELGVPPPYRQESGSGTGQANVGTNLRMNLDNTSRPQNEFSLAINPRNPDNFLASANDYRSGVPVLGRYASLDGGKSIAADGTLPLAGWTNSGDPSVGFDGFGNGYVAGVHFNRTPLSGALFVHKTTDGGRTFQAPSLAFAVTRNLPDKPLLTVDQRTSGQFAGSLYLTFTGFMVAPIGLHCVHSRDGGQTWSSPVPLGTGQGTSPAIGPAGEVYVSWLSGTSILFNASTDGGQSFGGARVVAGINPIPSRLPPGFRCFSFPTTAVDRSSGPFRGRVHVCWSSRSGSSAEIFATFSDDGGVSWSAPVQVNDQTAGDQFFQWMAVDEAGAVFACWHDRRNDPNNRTHECFASASYDGGRTWVRNWKVSEGTNDPGTSSFIGDYNGLDARRGRAFATWVDLRRGNQDAFTAPVQADLEFSPTALSAAAGGTIDLPIKAGPARAGQVYLVVANLSGTNPGVPVGQGMFFLNLDPLVYLSAITANTAPFLGTLGVLGPGGIPANPPRFSVPPGLLGPLIGVDLSFVYVLLDPAASVTYGSNPVSVRIGN